MPQRCAEPLRPSRSWTRNAVLAVGVLLLAACKSTPLPPLEQYPSTPVSTPTPAPAPAPQTLETAPLKDEPATVSENAAPAAPTAPATPAAVAPEARPAPIAPLALNNNADVPPQAQQQFEQAVAQAQAGDLAGAERAFDTLNAQYPSYAGPLINLAILRAKAGKLEAAEQTLLGAIERNPSSPQAFNQLGVVYRRLGRFKDADTAYQRAIELDPYYANAYLNLGVLCDLYLQQPQRALEAFERYLERLGKPDTKVSGWVTELKRRIGNSRSARSEQ